MKNTFFLSVAVAVLVAVPAVLFVSHLFQTMAATVAASF